MSTALSTSSVAQTTPVVKPEAVKSVDYYCLTRHIPLSPEHEHGDCACPLCARPAKMPLVAWYVTLPEDILVREFRALKYQRSLRWRRNGAYHALTRLIPVLLQLGLVRASWEASKEEESHE